MNSFNRTRLAAAGALALCAALTLSSKSALASSHFDVGVGLNFSRPVYTAPTHVYVAPSYYDGHYETRTESVLVEPAHCERRWINPVYETRYYYGRPQSVCITEGGWREFCTPARYETRYVQVWVPGSVVVTPAPRYYAPTYTGSYLDFTYRSRK